MLLLGIDIGTSFIKVSVVDAHTFKTIVTVQCPETEASIIAHQSGWAEQSPDTWWKYVQESILKVNATSLYNPKEIGSIGIAYQMHGLVLVDKNQQVLRDSIIWCDSRAVEIGNKAFDIIGKENCLSHLLNSPGNFTASKLAWVKEHEPAVYSKVDKVMLPGDYIAMKLTGEISTTISALSEGTFWDFKNNCVSEDLMQYFGFDKSLLPEVKEVFSDHGKIKSTVAKELSLSSKVIVSYKAGDQQNNALSLNVLEPGDVAATAGTSGVIYAVSDDLQYDKLSRVNTFAHVNHTVEETRLGILLCINGTGILNSWVKKLAGSKLSYKQIDEVASGIEAGSNGLLMLPFGNGAERMLNNKTIGAQIQHIDLNKHTAAHIYRAAQESIAFAFRYGLDIMLSNGVKVGSIRAGKANMFKSPVFTEAFVNATNVTVSLYDNDGSVGAAIGAGIGTGFYKDAREAFAGFKPIETIMPCMAKQYNVLYENWKELLHKHIGK